MFQWGVDHEDKPGLFRAVLMLVPAALMVVAALAFVVGFAFQAGANLGARFGG